MNIKNDKIFLPYDSCPYFDDDELVEMDNGNSPDNVNDHTDPIDKDVEAYGIFILCFAACGIF